MDEREMIEEIKALRAEVRMFKAQDVMSIYSAIRDVKKLTQDRYMASGVIVQITNLTGKELVEPVLIQDGLSDDTIAALTDDLNRTMKIRLDYIMAEPKKKDES